MKKLMLVTAMVLGFAGMSFAQGETANTGALVKGNVVMAVGILESGTLDFGNIAVNSTPTPINPNSAPSVPLFTVTGAPSAQVYFTFGSSLSLTGPGTPLTFTPNLVGSNVTGNQSGATTVNSGNTNLVPLDAVNGNYFVWLGGSVAAIPALQTVGAYSGTFTLTVTYAGY